MFDWVEDKTDECDHCRRPAEPNELFRDPSRGWVCESCLRSWEKELDKQPPRTDILSSR